MLKRFKPYFRYLHGVRGTLTCAVMAVIVYAGTNGLGIPYIVGKVLPRLFDPGTVRLSESQIFLVALLLPASFLVRGVSGFLSNYLFQTAGVRILEALRLDYFRKLQILPLSFIQKQTSGDLISRGLADTNQLQATLTTVANNGITQPATLVFGFVSVAWVAFHQKGVGLMLASIAFVPLCVFPVRYVGKKLLKRAYDMQTQLGSLTSTLTDNLGAAKEVRAFGLQERQAQAFAKETSALIRAQLKVAKYQLALSPAIEVVSAFGLAVVFVYAYHLGVASGPFSQIVATLYFSYDAVKKLGAINNDLKRGEASLNRLEFVFNEPVSIEDPLNPTPLGRARGDISFKNVTFAYTADEPVLRNISAVIPSGTVCALVGPSGAGKTTFANLVPRFFDVNEGSVAVDGVDVRQATLADLRGNMAVVSQDPVLFNDTIFNNLLLGRLDATPEEVRAAAVKAHADEFIRSFAEGYDTVVGERGARLSGGQKQRLAIARAFLRNAPILILDEATSALDAQVEQLIQESLQNLVVGKTVLIIAHRFSTIRYASLILVFDEGAIVARGSHAELYAADGLYRALYDHQKTGAA